MEKIFRVFSLLLLTLILNVQPYSSAPIPAEVVQSSAVVEETGPEEHTLVEKREPVKEKHIPDDAAEAAPFPDEPPAEEVISVAETDPVSQQPAAQEALAVEKTAQVVAEEAAPDQNVEVDLVNSEPLEQDSEEAPAPEAPGPLILAGDPEEKTSEDVAEPEAEEGDQMGQVAGETTTKEAEQKDLVVHGDSADPESDPEEQESAVLISSSETEEQVPEEQAKEGFVPIAPEEDPATNEESFLSTPEEEESIILVPAQPETEVEDQIGPAADETTPEDSTQVPVNSQLEEQEEIVPASSSEIKEEAPEHTEEEEEEEEEEDSLALVPAEPETEEMDQTGPAAKETAPEDPAGIVPVDSDEQEDIEILPGTQEEEDPLVIAPLEDETEGESEEETRPEPIQEEPAVFVLVEATDEEESTTGEPNLIIPLGGAEQEEAVQVYFTEAVSEEDPDEEATAAPVADIDADSLPAAVKDGNHTNILLYTNESKAALLPIHDEPMALVNRGAILGAALFTLMSFIVVGFVGLTISKKLR